MTSLRASSSRAVAPQAALGGLQYMTVLRQAPRAGAVVVAPEALAPSRRCRRLLASHVQSSLGPCLLAGCAAA